MTQWTTHDDRWGRIAVGHKSDSGDLEIYHYKVHVPCPVKRLFEYF